MIKSVKVCTSKSDCDWSDNVVNVKRIINSNIKITIIIMEMVFWTIIRIN